MDFYLTEFTNKNAVKSMVHFTMNPEGVRLAMGTMTQDHNLMNLGELRLPKGNKLDSVQWEGMLPASSRIGMSYVKDWKHPADIMKLLKRYKETGVCLRLLITETPINMDVFIEDLQENHSATMWGYSITLTQYKKLTVQTVDEWKTSTAGTKPTTATTPPRTTTAQAKTYTVKSGDTLWKIAKATLGDGNRYMEIFNKNKPPLTDPDVIQVGQVLKLP